MEYLNSHWSFNLISNPWIEPNEGMMGKGEKKYIYLGKEDPEENEIKDKVVETIAGHWAAISELDWVSKPFMSDNAWVPVELWSEWIKPMFPNITSSQLETSLNVLRSAMLRWRNIKVLKEAVLNLEVKSGNPKRAANQKDLKGEWMSKVRYNTGGKIK